MKAPSWLSKLITDLIEEEDLDISPLASCGSATDKLSPLGVNLNRLYNIKGNGSASLQIPLRKNSQGCYDSEAPLSFGPLAQERMSSLKGGKSTSFENLTEDNIFFAINERPMNKINSTPTFSYQNQMSCFSHPELEQNSQGTSPSNTMTPPLKFRSDTPEHPLHSELIDERPLAFSAMSSMTNSNSSSPVQMLSTNSSSSNINQSKKTQSQQQSGSLERSSGRYEPSPYSSYGNKKTILCKYYMKGNCVHGVKCAFAHGERELLVTAQDKENQRHSKVKTKPCKNLHETGYCQFGTKCLFLHSPTEVQRTKSPNQSQNVEKLYKTEPCRHFFKTGVCMFGDKCMFAHGQSERRDKICHKGLAIEESKEDHFEAEESGHMSEHLETEVQLSRFALEG
eukprot:maker-scaffold460_size165339-snap-gene-0.24 protein:Tk08601 transcript:maker-scaffold460_size165339-snap-gene-0.24-mRNA-1 annotation:"zinc finger protein c3h1 type-like 2-a-like"